MQAVGDAVTDDGDAADAGRAGPGCSRGLVSLELPRAGPDPAALFPSGHELCSVLSKCLHLPGVVECYSTLKGCRRC